jgi:hypothetical protein
MKKRMQGPTRREIVIAAASVVLSGAGTWLALRPRGATMAAKAVELADTEGPPSIPHQVHLRALAPDEYATLVAASERVFPRDESPGATDLGVAAYIDRALAEDDGPAWGDDFRTGLSRLDAESKERFGAPFHRARADDQDTLIGAWTGDREPVRSRFVRRLVVATLEGALGDPVHGGNARGMGWTGLGFQIDAFSPSAARL